MQGLNNATTRGRGVLAASLALLLALSAAPSAFAAWQAGLQEGTLTGKSAMDTTSEPSSWTTVLSPVAGGTTGWGGYKVKVYRGKSTWTVRNTGSANRLTTRPGSKLTGRSS